MELQKFTGKEIEGVVFNGTFEAAVEIVNAVKEAVGLDKVYNFDIQFNRAFDHKAILSFTLTNAPQPKGSTTTKSIILHEGDVLTVAGEDYDIVPSGMFRKFFKTA